ncbi:MAG: photosystem II S4 domain protein [Clostridiales bacterium]|jgi:photosystem II S4 domain protein|nr:photosystem II S4 domain protein [Clostridiales bacterium]
MEREKILERFEHETERLAAATALDRAVQTEKTGMPQATDFLDPYQQRAVEKALHLHGDVKYISWGGYQEAERVRVLVFPVVRQMNTGDVPLAVLEADAGSKADGLSHRDFLGAILGLGLKREKIGDIIVADERCAQIFVSPEIVPYLQSNLIQVGSHSVSIREMDVADVAATEPRNRDVKATVASLRLDAVASAGFGLSRSKLAPAIRAGQVKLNWQSVKSASTPVKQGDIISLAGRGRMELAEVRGESKKGRIHLLLKKRI